MSNSICNENSFSTKSNLYLKTSLQFKEQRMLDNSISSFIFSNENKDKQDSLTMTGTKSNGSKGKWSIEEDKKLKHAVTYYGAKNWKNVSNHVEGRTPTQCLHRWAKILQPGLVKGPWTVEEDKTLLEWISKEGPMKWSSCSQLIKGRSGKQCRERYFNILKPNVRKGNWTYEEDYVLFKMFNQFGSQWSKISKFFKGRTENSIKNRFYSTLRRIATDKKKTIKKVEKNEESLSSNFKELAKFVPDAISEKTFDLMNKKRKNQGSLSKESESMKSPLELVNNDNFCNNMNMNFPPLFESSFENNNFNNEANYDILPFHENYLLKNEDEYSFNIMPLNLLEQKIENYQIDYECQKNENNTDIDKQLKGFIDNLFDNSTKDNEPNFCNNCERLEKAFDNNNNNINNNALISTIQQIEELEKILKETRVELLKKSFECHR